MLVRVFDALFCARDRGCGAHPVFPAPSVFQWARFPRKTSGASRRENAKSYLSRHCERSEAIHSTTQRKNGLLRRFTPRNDDLGCLIVEYETHLTSSLRTQGPIAIGLGMVNGLSHHALSIDHAVWVPAFAGTTSSLKSLRRVPSLPHFEWRKYWPCRIRPCRP